MFQGNLLRHLMVILSNWTFPESPKSQIRNCSWSFVNNMLLRFSIADFNLCDLLLCFDISMDDSSTVHEIKGASRLLDPVVKMRFFDLHTELSLSIHAMNIVYN